VTSSRAPAGWGHSDATGEAEKHLARDVLIVWNEGNWRCEIHTGGIPGEGRFLV
jgi:hypothetical protein